MTIPKLRFVGFDARPDHMAALSKIAAQDGLTRGALLRQMIAKFVRRERRKTE